MRCTSRDVVEASDISRAIHNMTRSFGLPIVRNLSEVRSYKLAVISEAAADLPDELKARHVEVPWPRIVAFRNILVHAYFGIDWDLVWRAANKESPFLRTQIEVILRSEFGGA